ncbi:CHRD domain-containing protein [Agromyces albus]|uniref:CHRD domain-containing protein n=1 Tax=Agromyces albus TaxID=205332 RepID=UPI0027D7A885|nr:CHRD domain-containing protein [Agromyces albus]
MTSRTRSTALAIAAIAALAFTGAGAAAAAPPDSPQIPLNTGQEAPAPTVGSAHGTFSYEIEGDQLCWELSVTGLSSGAVAAHIHIGERNAPGPVVVPLTVDVGETSFETSGCATPDADLLAAIEEDPRAYYVNVHTTTNSPGEIRGQLK